MMNQSDRDQIIAAIDEELRLLPDSTLMEVDTVRDILLDLRRITEGDDDE